jgi:hypothetical protein
MKLVPKQENRQAEKLRQSVKELEGSLRTIPFLRGVGQYLQDVEHAAGASKAIPLRLGRAPRGWMPLSVRTAAGATTVDLFETARAKDTLTLETNSSADLTYDLWVW